LRGALPRGLIGVGVPSAVPGSAGGLGFAARSDGRAPTASMRAGSIPLR
jgi:hypothetical protein